MKERRVFALKKQHLGERVHGVWPCPGGFHEVWREDCTESQRSTGGEDSSPGCWGSGGPCRVAGSQRGSETPVGMCTRQSQQGESTGQDAAPRVKGIAINTWEGFTERREKGLALVVRTPGLRLAFSSNPCVFLAQSFPFSVPHSLHLKGAPFTSCGLK